MTTHDAVSSADDDFGAYEALTVAHDDHRWAYGTGFTDPLAGVDTSLPPDLDPVAHVDLLLRLGDDALVLSHRLQEWITRLPELEEEAAVANVALDLLGQARVLLARAGGILGRTEDELAMHRDAADFRCSRLVELVDRDFADLVVRLLVVATTRLQTMTALRTSPDAVLAAVAGRAVAELRYHRDHAAAWVVRLGDGTDESHMRTQAAVDRLWPYALELDADLAEVAAVLAAATLETPAPQAIPGRGGHTEHLAPLLAEMQALARAHPDATW